MCRIIMYKSRAFWHIPLSAHVPELLISKAVALSLGVIWGENDPTTLILLTGGAQTTPDFQNQQIMTHIPEETELMQMAKS